MSVQAGDEGIESHPEEKDPGVLVDEKLGMTRHCALAAQRATRALGCIPCSVAGRAREGALPLCPALVRPPCSAASSSGVLSTGEMWSCWSGARGDHGDGQRLEQLCCGYRLGELGGFSLGKRRLQGDLRAPASTYEGLQERWRVTFYKGR